MLKTSKYIMGIGRGCTREGAPVISGVAVKEIKHARVSPVHPGPSIQLQDLSWAWSCWHGPRTGDIGTVRAKTFGPYVAPVGTLQWKEESPC